MRFTGLVAAPVFRPSEEEFSDPSVYITKIKDLAEPFGICKIIPPPSWKPNFALDEKTKFRTKVQNLGKLLHRPKMSEPSSKRRRVSDRRSSNEMTSANSNSVPEISEEDILNYKKRKTNLNSDLKFCVKCNGTSFIDQALACSLCERYYHKFCIAPYSEDKIVSEWFCKECQMFTGKSYGYQDGGSLSIEEYKEEAEACKKIFSEMFSLPENASLEQLEEVYWKIIESQDENILVRYGSDVDTGRSGSGFETQGKYGNSPWNVNKFPFASRSLLKHLGRKISGVMRPWLCKCTSIITF
jgi:hypothetical protein